MVQIGRCLGGNERQMCWCMWRSWLQRASGGEVVNGKDRKVSQECRSLGEVRMSEAGGNNNMLWHYYASL